MPIPILAIIILASSMMGFEIGHPVKPYLKVGEQVVRVQETHILPNGQKAYKVVQYDRCPLNKVYYVMTDGSFSECK